MRERGRHPMDAVLNDGPPIEMEDSADSAHEVRSVEADVLPRSCEPRKCDSGVGWSESKVGTKLNDFAIRLQLLELAQNGRFQWRSFAACSPQLVVAAEPR